MPTLIRLRTAAFSDATQYRSDPNLIYVDPATRALWEQLGRQFADQVPPDAAVAFQCYYGLQQRTVKMLS